MQTLGHSISSTQSIDNSRVYPKSLKTISNLMNWNKHPKADPHPLNDSLNQEFIPHQFCPQRSCLSARHIESCFKELRPEIVIVEEAAEVLEAWDPEGPRGTQMVPVLVVPNAKCFKGLDLF